MEPRLKRSATVSLLLHLAVLVVALFFMPPSDLPSPGEPDEIAMEFTGPSHKGPRTHKSAAATQSEHSAPAHPAAPPRLGSTQAAHAPPPRPRPTPPPQPAPPPPPKSTPVPLPTPPLPKPPPEPAKPPPPKPRPPKPRPTPKPPKETPSRESAQESTDLAAALSHLRAGHPQGRREAHEESDGAMEGALAKLRSGGEREAGGNPNSANDNGGLSSGQRGAIADGVRRCWDYDAGAKGAESFSVQLRVVTDAQGVARMVTFAPQEGGHMAADPFFRAFAERARRTVLDPRCASLALPSSFLGGKRTIDFRFRP